MTKQQKLFETETQGHATRFTSGTKVDELPDSYHNTTKVKGAQLAEYRAKAKGQDLAVVNFFMARPGQTFTPDEVHALVGTGSPLTSTRRSMTTLTSLGILVKTSTKKIGTYGRPAHCWKLNDGQELRP